MKNNQRFAWISMGLLCFAAGLAKADTLVPTPAQNVVIKAAAQILKAVYPGQVGSIDALSAPAPAIEKTAVRNTSGVKQAPVVLNYSDRGKTVELSKGQNLVLRLRYNPSSGNHWVITDNNDQLLKFLSETKGFEGHPGTPGMQTFEFRAEAEGTVSPTLKYVGPSAPDHSFNVTVNIH